MIGASMGGLAARYAALPPGRASRSGGASASPACSRSAARSAGRPGRRHPAEPAPAPGRHADRVVAGPAANGRRRGDAYAVYSYVRLHDDEVGPANAAVPGVTPWWVSGPPWPRPTHHGSFLDRRILADVAARLRGEAPPVDRAADADPAATHDERRTAAAAGRRPEPGVQRRRRDLGQRHQDEPPGVHQRVRHDQVGRVDHVVAVQQQVEVDRPRPPPLHAAPGPARPRPLEHAAAARAATASSAARPPRSRTAARRPARPRPRSPAATTRP